jgi:hypothetical protein
MLGAVQARAWCFYLFGEKSPMRQGFADFPDAIAVKLLWLLWQLWASLRLSRA